MASGEESAPSEVTQQQIHTDAGSTPTAPYAQAPDNQTTAPGYPTNEVPGYPPNTAPGYPPNTAPGYPPNTAPGYSPNTAPGYPPNTAPGYPPNNAGYGYPPPPAGYPTNVDPAYPPPPYPGTGAPPTYPTAQYGTAPSIDHAKNFPPVGAPLHPSQTSSTVYMTNNQQMAGPTAVTIIRQPGNLPPNNYLALSIFSTVCCCLVFGIVAIIKSMKVNALWYEGQHEEARKAADEAKKWNIVAIVVGIAFVVVVNVIRVFASV